MKSIEVAVAVIKNNDKYFVTKRGYGPFKGMWEFPGGKVEKMKLLKLQLKER